MGKRPAKCYRRIQKPPYTRKEYIKTIPGSRVVLYDMGNKKANFPVKVGLFSMTRQQIISNALEAARVAANKYLSRNAEGQYFFRIVVHPHHIIREHKLMNFAGADRLQQGMTLAFGKPVARAARVEVGQLLMYVATVPEKFEVAMEALRRAAMKIGGRKMIKLMEGPEELTKRFKFKYI